MSEKKEIYETAADNLAEAGYIQEAVEMLGKGYDIENIVKELPSTMSGFTPAPDFLIKKYGFVTALVWGRIWRYCQMRDGICRAKIETIAAELGMSDRTIFRHVDPLVADGYLKDVTPDLKNRPHIYADTGKIRIRISVEATMTESQGTMTESQSHPDRESDEESIKKESKKKDMVDFILENEKSIQPIDEACKAFESALGVNPWPWQSNSDWSVFARWIEKTYREDKTIFQDYVKWRRDDGKYQAMSNNKIRQNPRMFMDTGWPTFLAHSSMYGKSQEEEKEPYHPEYEKVVADPEQEKKYIPIPEHLRRKS
jgi:hypothetical protein